MKYIDNKSQSFNNIVIVLNYWEIMTCHYGTKPGSSYL